MNEPVSQELAEIALDRVEGFAFERFAQTFYSALEGRDFVPLGGIKDGGADGLFECGKDGVFYQFTRVEDHRAKIRATHKRLLEFGRKLKTIVYVSARSIPHLDKEEELLTEELSVFVRIRDRKYIVSHINDSTGTSSAYHSHLSTYTHFLESVSRQKAHQPSAYVNDPSVFVFLQNEVSNRLGKRKIIHSVTDTLILSALSETDPDKDIFMSEVDIYEKIKSDFAWSDQIIKPHFSSRIKDLRTKGEVGREIRYYKKQGYYCLPYETREKIKSENAQDESLRIEFLDEISLIASENSEIEPSDSVIVSDIVMNVVHSIFKRQGLKFSHFISSKDIVEPPLVVSDCIEDALQKYTKNTNKIKVYREVVETVMRRLLYHASQKQLNYLKQLSRTYVLLFSLQSEPKVIEYFSNLSASFRLFLGSDILVKALSERYLEKENQVARNLLRISSDSGMKLLLSDCVVDEVYTHVKGTYYEFYNHFSKMEPYITEEISNSSRKILIRAYFHAKREKKISGWKAFLGQFVTYENIESLSGRDEIKNYLMSEFNLEFVDNTDLESVSPPEKVKVLSEKLFNNDVKSHENLAYNTALQIYGVYGLRLKNKETSKTSEFGLKTWWVTNQTRVLEHTSELVEEKRQEYIMRPEYILNFISMSPACIQARETFDNIFPSTFGIQLGNRMKEDMHQQIMVKVNNWHELEPGRVMTLMSNLTDRLKCDREKLYENNIASYTDD